MEKREPSYIVGVNGKYSSHYGEQCGNSFKKLEIEQPFDQQSHCWAHTARKPELKETHAPQCSSQHCLQYLGHGNNIDIHKQTNA